MSVLPRRRWQWPNPHLHVADSGTGEQPAREECDGRQDVVLELLDQHGLHDRDLVARRCRVVARERALCAGGREMERRAVSGQRVAAAARPEREGRGHGKAVVM